MAKIITSEAIVLNRKIVQEQDIVADLFLADGQMGIIRGFGLAKGSKRSAIIFTPGNIIDLSYSIFKNNFLNYKEGIIHLSILEKKQSYQKLMIISYLLRTISEVIRYQQEQVPVYHLLKGTLIEYARLFTGRMTNRIIFLMVFFLVRLLKNQGYAGDLQHCLKCNNEIRDYALWQIPELSFVCKNCDEQATTEMFWMQRIIQCSQKRYHHYIVLLKNLDFIENNLADCSKQDFRLLKYTLQCLNAIYPSLTEMANKVQMELFGKKETLQVS